MRFGEAFALALKGASETRWRLGRAAAALVILAGALVLTASSTPASASGVVLSVSPSLVEMSATPGGSGDQQVIVYNEGSSPFDVAALVAPYKETTGNYSAVSWLSVTPGRFHLEPGGQQKVDVHVQVPAGATSGGRYAKVTFTSSGGVIVRSGTALSGQLGIPFLITVQGGQPLQKKVALGDLFPELNPNGAVTLGVDVQNEGNVHVFAAGQIVVTDDSSSTVGVLQIPESTPILPQTTELVNAAGMLMLTQGNTYHAKATINYGGGAPEVSETTFTVNARLQWDSLQASPQTDGSLQIQGGLRNSGQVGVVPRVSFTLTDKDGQLVYATHGQALTTIWPGMSLQGDIPVNWRLNPGSYQLVAAADYGADQQTRSETTFTVGHVIVPTTNPGWGEQPKPHEMGGTHWGFWVGGGIGLAILAAAAGAATVLFLTHHRHEPDDHNGAGHP